MRQQKSIFITGAASGIGRETALLFSRKGWFVGIVDIDEEGLKSLASEIGSEKCFVRGMDVTDPEEFQKCMDAFVEQTGGRLEVLFNNAGILRMGLNESISLEEKHLIIDINVKGVITGIDCALPYLKKTPGARILSMCSSSAVYGIPELAVYSASKHAIRALTEALDIELERYGIAVSDIIPPYVNTPMVTGAERQAHSVSAIGVPIGPREVAAKVWKAAHGNRKKLHWRVHWMTHLLFGVAWLLPFLKRPMIKRLTLSPDNG